MSRFGLIRRDKATDASVHDSRAPDDILDETNTASDVGTDSRTGQQRRRQSLLTTALRSRIHRKARRNRPLSKREQQGNRTRSKVWALVEPVFGAQANDMGGRRVRSIGIVRGKARIGLKNLADNMRRGATSNDSPPHGHRVDGRQPAKCA